MWEDRDSVCAFTMAIAVCFVISMSELAFGQSGYRLSDVAVRQAEKAAKRDFGRGRSARRPDGLDSLDSDEAIRFVVLKSMEDLSNPNRSIQEKAVGRLRYLGAFAFRDLVDGLKADSSITRKWSSKLLSYRGTPAVPHLSEALKSDPTDYVRSTAARSLGQIFDPSAGPALLAGLEDEDFHVSADAIRALGDLKDNQAVEPLKKLLDDSHVDGQLREAAAESLLRIDKDAGTKAIREALAREPNESIRHNFNVILKKDLGFAYWPPELLELRQLTRDALTLAGESFGDKEIGQFLQYADSPYWAVSSGCHYALGELNAVSGVPTLLALAPKSWSACNALANIATPQAVEYLLSAVQSPDESTRHRGMEALQSQGGRWAVPVLIELLDDATRRTTHKGERIWPDEHKAHAALHLCLARAGLDGRYFNVAHPDGETFSVDVEIRRLKDWWAEHGEDFLQGRPVPSPNITLVFSSS